MNTSGHGAGSAAKKKITGAVITQLLMAAQTPIHLGFYASGSYRIVAWRPAHCITFADPFGVFRLHVIDDRAGDHKKRHDDCDCTDVRSIVP